MQKTVMMTAASLIPLAGYAHSAGLVVHGDMLTMTSGWLFAVSLFAWFSFRLSFWLFDQEHSGVVVKAIGAIFMLCGWLAFMTLVVSCVSENLSIDHRTNGECAADHDSRGAYLNCE